MNNQEFNYNTIRTITEQIPRKLNLINCWEEEIKVEPGTPSVKAGASALTALKDAVTDLAAGNIDVLVTGPVDKNSIKPEGIVFTGHTEFIGRAFNVPDPLMFLVSGSLRVALVTGHVPVTQVAPLITKERIHAKLAMMIASLKRDFNIRKPRIAVLGLNPHAGDGGLLGKEELEIIQPAVKEAFEKGQMVFGPYSSDGFFGAGLHQKFDAVLAMYHDQGLIPFKTLAFENGVNFTAGLPIVRTSPDHGTAYDLAGKGTANETSLRESIYLALDIYQNRLTYDEVTEKPLAFSKMQGDR
jgi:4-hydroxythreonine-4-phosphate dehydrogenase